MRQINDRTFLDTNILIYFFTDQESEKGLRSASAFADHNVVISTQVLQEFANVMLKKFRLPNQQVAEMLNACTELCQVYTNTDETIKKALTIHQNQKFSFFDSLIVAAARESGCGVLLTEDMHACEIGGLRMENPFKTISTIKSI